MDRTLYCRKSLTEQPNKYYTVKKLNSNKTQILHRIRLRKFEPNTVLQDIRPEGNLQPDDEIIIPQDDLYVLTWETNFGEFHNSTEEVTISTRRDALDTSNNLVKDASTPDEVFTDVDFRSTGPHKNDDFASLEKPVQNVQMTGLTINNRQEGAILSCPKYQTMKTTI